jgi:hypothetical protein
MLFVSSIDWSSFPLVQGWPEERANWQLDLVKSIYYDGVVHWPAYIIDLEPIPLLESDPSDPPYHGSSPDS